jgi:hypothetical protein
VGKEHAGGPPEEYREYHESRGGRSRRELVQCKGFDFSGLDSLWDCLVERAATGLGVEPVLEEWFRERKVEACCDVIARVLEFIITSDRPKWVAYQLAVACGMDITMGLSGPAIAGLFGDSKQAFFQGVERLRDELGLRKTVSMRDEEARGNMRKANYRPVTGVTANAAGAAKKGVK